MLLMLDNWLIPFGRLIKSIMFLLVPTKVVLSLMKNRFLSAATLSLTIALSSALPAKAQSSEWFNPFDPQAYFDALWNGGMNTVVHGQTMRNSENQYLGALDHSKFWTFCSNNNYQSYYDQGNSVICGYEAYDRFNTNPQGVYYSYSDVCNGYFGRTSFYDEQKRACVAAD